MGLPYISLGYLQSAAEYILLPFSISDSHANLQSHINAFESKRNLVNLGRPEKDPLGTCFILLL